MEDSRRTSTDDEARRHARRRRRRHRCRRPRQRRREDPRQSRSREQARARHIQYNHYLQTALICDRNGEVTGRRRDDVELSPRHTSDGPT